jgi:hypothetical protein
MMRVQALPHPRASDGGAEVTSEAPTTSAATDSTALVRAEQRLALQRQRFDVANERRAEFMREHDAMRDLLMAMLKSEDMYMKKWIEMI